MLTLWSQRQPGGRPRSQFGILTTALSHNTYCHHSHRNITANIQAKVLVISILKTWEVLVQFSKFSRDCLKPIFSNTWMTSKSILPMTQLDVSKPPIVWLGQLERSATLENIGKHCPWRQCPIGDITRGQWALDNNCSPWPQNASKHFYGVVTKEIYKNMTLLQCWCWFWCWCCGWCWG